MASLSGSHRCSHLWFYPYLPVSHPKASCVCVTFLFQSLWWNESSTQRLLFFMTKFHLVSSRTHLNNPCPKSVKLLKHTSLSHHLHFYHCLFGISSLNSGAAALRLDTQIWKASPGLGLTGLCDLGEVLLCSVSISTYAKQG